MTTDPLKKKPKVIAVILAYNCARLLPKAYQKIPKDMVDDIIAMDDGSKDGTLEVAMSLGIKAFRHDPNRGYGGNLKAGLQKALEMGADYIVEIHGDGAQFDPISLTHAQLPISQGAQLILGSRFRDPRRALANGMPLIRFVANRALSFFDRLVLGLPLTEFHTGFRIYGRRLLEQAPYLANSNNYLFSFEIIAQAAYYGLPVAEVPVEADYKNEHTSCPLDQAVVYSFETFRVLAEWVLAKRGIRYSKTFPPKPAHVPSSDRQRKEGLPVESRELVGSGAQD